MRRDIKTSFFRPIQIECEYECVCAHVVVDAAVENFELQFWLWCVVAFMQ